MKDPTRGYTWKAGIGLRPAHYPAFETTRPKHVQWLEAISENYMDSYGRPREILFRLRKDYPIALHGVSMGLASVHKPTRTKYLEKLAHLVSELDPFIVSDHLCWTSTARGEWHDLLPFPFTEESLNLVLENLDQAQSRLKRPIYIENISAYAHFPDTAYSEREFLVEVAQRAGTRLLLDINNIYVNAQNQGFDAWEFIAGIPVELIGQLHLAGHTDYGEYLFDTHAEPVAEAVWELFRRVMRRCPHLPFMLERDENIPALHELDLELGYACQLAREAQHDV